VARRFWLATVAPQDLFREFLLVLDVLLRLALLDRDFEAESVVDAIKLE
jgi:hypothetical protein